MDIKRIINIVVISLLVGVIVYNFSWRPSKIPTGDPESRFTQKNWGKVAYAGVVAGKNNSAIWPHEIVHEFKKPTKYSTPTAASVLKAKNTCHFRKVRKDEHAGVVFVGGSNTKAGIFAFSKNKVIKRAETHLRNQAFRSNPDNNHWIDEIFSVENMNGSRGEDSMQYVDVFITQTDKPVYLILTSQNAVIWNIHKAKDVIISNIAAISTHGIAFANLDSSIPVSILYGKRKLKQCKVNPVRRPEKHMRYVQRASLRDELDAVAKQKDVYRKYLLWFKTKFGVSPEDNVVGELRVSHVLVGPKPLNNDALIRYIPLSESQIQIANQDHIVIGGEHTYDEFHKKIVIEKIEKILGKKPS